MDFYQFLLRYELLFQMTLEYHLQLFHQNQIKYVFFIILKCFIQYKKLAPFSTSLRFKRILLKSSLPILYPLNSVIQYTNEHF